MSKSTTPQFCIRKTGGFNCSSLSQKNTEDTNASSVFFGAGGEARLHFRYAKIIVSLRQAVARNSPPDCSIKWFAPLQ